MSWLCYCIISLWRNRYFQAPNREDELLTEVAELREKLKNKDKDIQKLNGDISALTRTKTELCERVEKLKTEVDVQKDLRRDAKDELQCWKSSYKRICEEATGLRAEVRRMRKDLEDQNEHLRYYEVIVLCPGAISHQFSASREPDTRSKLVLI